MRTPASLRRLTRSVLTVPTDTLWMVSAKRGCAELLDLPEVGGAELVQRDRLVVLVLVLEGVEAGGDGI